MCLIVSDYSRRLSQCARESVTLRNRLGSAVAFRRWGYTCAFVALPTIETRRSITWDVASYKCCSQHSSLTVGHSHVGRGSRFERGWFCHQLPAMGVCNSVTARRPRQAASCDEGSTRSSLSECDMCVHQRRYPLPSSPKCVPGTSTAQFSFRYQGVMHAEKLRANLRMAKRTTEPHCSVWLTSLQLTQ
jgi:hypothetical protein